MELLRFETSFILTIFGLSDVSHSDQKVNKTAEEITEE